MISECGWAEPCDIRLAEDNHGGIRLTKEAFKTGKIENTLHVVKRRCRFAVSIHYIQQTILDSDSAVRSEVAEYRVRIQ